MPVISDVSAQSVSEINTLGNSIISSLKNNDPSGFLQAHVTAKDLPELDKNYTSKSKDKQIEMDREESFQTMQDNFSTQFEEIIQKGIQDQINWKEIQFSRVENTSQPQKDGNLQVIENPVVVFSYKDQERKLNLGKIAKLKRGWVILDKISME
jgi:GH35 family endo-1,4-beta-xylanase